MRQVKHKTLAQLTYEELRRSFFYGEFTPNESITIAKLSKKLEVGIVPIREAVHRLASQGAFEILPNRLIRVPEYDKKELKKLYDARIILECYATELAAKNMGEVAYAELRSTLSQIEKFCHTGKNKFSQAQAIKMQVANARFHFIIYEKCDNQFVVETIERFWLCSGPRQMQYLKSINAKEQMKKLLPQHWELIDLLEARKAVQAKNKLKKMLTSGKKLFCSSPHN